MGIIATQKYKISYEEQCASAKIIVFLHKTNNYDK
jgi:hypothetical protein